MIYATADTRLTTNYQQTMGSHAQSNSASHLQIRNNSASGSNYCPQEIDYNVLELNDVHFGSSSPYNFDLPRNYSPNST